ncbi:polysaccharide deacetylase family protein [Rhodanobacter sp. L36]|uniref:polysaccharide deacetylase family protein n=1 Tax=Rhodanobacter sp. L36 TaxID=1747221 RepID=UPI0015769A22|nr:polysaccharide deacetylase family protein [Rhodanobacter sp. L36]
MNQAIDEPGKAIGIRGRLGEYCYSSGALRPLQQLRAWWKKDLRILAYHRVLTLDDPGAFDFDLELVSTSAEMFREQMTMVKQRFRPMRMGDVIAALDSGKRLPADAVVVTFDDGYDDNYRVAFPILRELGVPATFFVSTGHIDSGQPFAYDWLVYMLLHTAAAHLVLPELRMDAPVPADRAGRRELAGEVLLRMKGLDDSEQLLLIGRMERDWNMPRAEAPAYCRPMSWSQVREMHAAGFEIGSHGVHHKMLAKLSPEELQLELRESKATLERELDQPATLLSYPVGGDRAFNDSVVRATKDAGYRMACSYVCGTNPYPLSNRYALRRLPVEREMGLGWFASMLTLPGLMSYPTTSRAVESGQGPACSS